MGEKFWLIKEDKALVGSMLGTEDVQFFVWLTSNNILSKFAALARDFEVQDRLSKVVEGSDWTYVIYWQVSTSKSRKSAGHCRKPKGTEKKDGNDYRVEGFVGGDRRNQVLKKIHTWFGPFGCSKDDTVAAKLDSVSELKMLIMLYVTSMYYAFPFDKSSTPPQAFNTSRTIWVSDPRSERLYHI